VTLRAGNDKESDKSWSPVVAKLNSDARLHKGDYPRVEVFCAIFAFGAIDSLVHEIEEATLEPPTVGQVPLRATLTLRSPDLAVVENSEDCATRRGR
jgi:hypothetical protein